MSAAKLQSIWTWDSYLDWEARRLIRYELVDGQVYAMAGETAEHDIIANNLRGELRTRLRGKPWRPHGPDLKVRAGTGGRYPDALIDCGPRVAAALQAQEPMAVFEVLSKCTGWIDQSLKLRDYDATPEICYYVLISQDEMRAMVDMRDEAGRLGIQSAVLLEGAEASVEIPELGLALPFSDLYEGLDLASEWVPAVLSMSDIHGSGLPIGVHTDVKTLFLIPSYRAVQRFGSRGDHHGDQHS